MIPKKRLQKIIDVVQNRSTTVVQFENRKAIVERLLRYIKESPDETELYARLLADYPVWSTAFMNNLAKVPLIPAPWQIEYSELLDDYEDVWGFCTRKTGKSTNLASKTVHRAIMKSKRIVAYAPTKGQQFVYTMMRRNCADNEFIKNTHIEESTASHIIFTNGSEIINRSIGAKERGEQSLGEIGDIILMDEYQLTDKAITTAVIKPIMWDTYSDKAWNLIGTPSLDHNPELDREWESWGACETQGCLHKFEPRETSCPKCMKPRRRITYHLGWEKAVEEGCISLERIERDRLEMTPDVEDMMLNAVFPKMTGRFYDRLSLYSCGKGALEFIPRGVAGREYIMSVDWAKERDRTQILVADHVNGVLKYVYWKQIFPEMRKKEDGKVVDYATQHDFVKSVAKDFDIKWINVDATSTQDLHVEALTSGTDKISPLKFHKTISAGGVEHLGYKATGEGNELMHTNHQLHITKGSIHVPRTKPFFSMWVNEHNQLQKHTAQGGRYIRLEAPRNGYKDLAVASAMLSMFLKSATQSPAIIDFELF